MQKIGQFGFGVSDFFEDSPKLKQNEGIQNFRKLMGAVYDNSIRFKRGNPRCELYYATTGSWQEDGNLTARINGVIEDLKRKNIFRDVEFLAIGATELQQRYTSSKNSVSKEFSFPSKVAIPDIDGVVEAYVGILSAVDFIGIIENENGEIIRSLFYDNVRDFQDYNKVNSEIRDTLNSQEKNRFPLMNNGITIIAKKLNVTGNKIYIEDFRIVNGCQTSHVLHNQKDQLDGSILIPLRLISTQDEDVTTSIIKATNRQTEVKEDQLLALSEYQKQIEKYFLTFEDNKLYYERRSKQYNNVIGIEKTRIVTLGNLIRSFGAIYLNEPHRATRYYQTLLEQVGKTIFESNHRLEMYYVSALALYKIDYYFRSQTLDSNFKLARYQILLAFRILITGKSLPPKNSNEMKRMCEKIIIILQNNEECERYFRCAQDVINDLTNGQFSRDELKTQSFSDKVIEKSTNWICKPI
ncbi:AIPR family protein [Deinococcus radiomollis]|uniref:AIPR family protein n=1 Tax=Deinococcus radiomollis TaxID=468916 RepID=UPI0038929D35